MNGKQLEDWLSEFSQRALPQARPISANGRAKAPGVDDAPVREHRKVLRDEAENARLLVQYIACNYERVELVHPLFGQLLAIYYRLGTGRYFTLQLLPVTIHLYLSSLQCGQQDTISMFETLFLAIYNEEILAAGPASTDMTKRTDIFRIPSIRYPSVYHDPVKLNMAPNLPPPHARDSVNSVTLCSVQVGPYPAIESIIGENRFIVLTRLVTAITSVIEHLALDVVCKPLCEMLHNIAGSSFRFVESSLRDKVLKDSLTESDALLDISTRPRIFAPSFFYVEALSAVNFCVFNGYATAGLRALDAIHQRAVFDVVADVLLVTNALRDLFGQDETRRLIQEIEKSRSGAIVQKT